MNYLKEMSDLEPGSKKALEKVTRISEMLARMYGPNLMDEIPKDLREKFQKQRDYLLAAIRRLDPVSINKQAIGMIKAYQAVDEQATASGVKKIPQEQWQVRHKGFDYVIVRTDAELPRKTEIVMASVEELLRALPDTFHEIKKQFPGAQVTEDFIDDEIPF